MRLGLECFLLLSLRSISLNLVCGDCVPGEVTRDPADCSVFYQCTTEGGHAFHCPAGLVFNQQERLCDWPDNVDCDTETNLISESSTAIVTTSHTTSVPDTTTSTTVSLSTTTNSNNNNNNNTESSVELSSCLSPSSEPISPEVERLRTSSCSISNQEVEKITAGRHSNPSNVKIVESVFSQEDFTEFFPRANPAYTYDNFLKAVGKFPSVCSQLEICKRTLATIFAHFQQETSGLYYLEEIAKSDYCATWSGWVRRAYPCTPGKQYYGRGAKQLSWNYNYGAFSVAMYGEASVLLQQPELVAETWLNFASGFWFFVTPQPPKPSMLHVIDGTWQPNSADSAAGISPGFGATINVINGGYECGVAGNKQSQNREDHYKKYCKTFGLDCHTERTDCGGMGKFSGAGSANPAIYWEPQQSCKLVTWQTAFSALIEGQHRQCQEEARSQPRILYYLLPAIRAWIV